MPISPVNSTVTAPAGSAIGTNTLGAANSLNRAFYSQPSTIAQPVSGPAYKVLTNPAPINAPQSSAAIAGQSAAIAGQSAAIAGRSAAIAGQSAAIAGRGLPTAPINTTPVSAPVNPVAAPVATPPAFKTPILPYVPVAPLPQAVLPPGAYYPKAPFPGSPTTIPYVPRPANIPSWAWPYPEPPLPNEMPSEAMEPGPVVNPGLPPPFRGGQSDGVCYLVTVSNGQGSTSTFRTRGPIGGVRTVTISGGGRLEVQSRSVPSPGTGTTCQVLTGSGWYFSGSGGSAWNAEKTASITSTMRVDGQPDTGGDPPSELEPVREPNPARRPNDIPRPLPPYDPKPLPQPEPQPEAEPETDLPWPQTPTPSRPKPLEPINPTAPAEVPGFNPQPPIEPIPPTAPTNPPEFTPEAPAEVPTPFGPAQSPSPLIIPIILPGSTPTPATPFLPSINPNTGKNLIPGPIEVPSGGIQPVITPSGPQIGTAPTENPEVKVTTPPVVQSPTIPGGCCPDLWGKKNWEELQRVKRSIGTDSMPVSVPDQIAKDNPLQIMIGSLAELHLWQVQQLDGVLGKWPVGIPIPTPAGTTTVGMPNVAEAVAEMVGMLVSQQVTAAQILNTSSRAMVQAGSATQQAHLAALTAQANADFLGYESRPSAVDMPLTYSPGKDLSDGLLNESVAKIKGFQNTDNTDIKAILAELLQAAAIIRAVYWRRLDPKGDLKRQIRENVRGQGDFLDEAAAGGGNDSDWEAYLKQVEEGFKASTGEVNPYGRPPEESPKIKDRSPGKEDKK